MKQWTNRKNLVVHASARLQRSTVYEMRAKSGKTFKETLRTYAHECIEDVISQMRHSNIQPGIVAYYMSISDRALERLITDVIKEKKL